METCLAIEGEVGLKLSVGLDSKTVATIVELVLKQVLHGYTHVSLRTY